MEGWGKGVEVRVTGVACVGWIKAEKGLAWNETHRRGRILLYIREV